MKLNDVHIFWLNLDENKKTRARRARRPISTSGAVYFYANSIWWVDFQLLCILNTYICMKILVLNYDFVYVFMICMDFWLMCIKFWIELMILEGSQSKQLFELIFTRIIAEMMIFLMKLILCEYCVFWCFYFDELKWFSKQVKSAKKAKLEVEITCRNAATFFDLRWKLVEKW